MGIGTGPGKGWTADLSLILRFRMIQTSLFLVFGWFQNMTSIAGLLTWFGICVVRVHFLNL
jgi:amino acid permease